MAGCGQQARRRTEVALIDEQACIGCTICIQKCPVDAIVGAPRRMHTVLTAECIGCRLCVAPCPVDCITMVVAPDGMPRVDPFLVRERYRFRRFRLAREAGERSLRMADAARRKLAELDAVQTVAGAHGTEAARKRAVIERALARAKARQQAGGR